MHSALETITTDDITRFWSYVDQRDPDKCWPWTKATSHGYGHFKLGRRVMASHQVAAFLSKGWPNPINLHTLHSCDNPICCNPSHLFYGTHGDNMRDATAKRRNGSHRHPERLKRGVCHYRSKLSLEQVRVIRSSKLSRMELSGIFSVSKATIQRLLTNQTYKEEL